MKTFAGRDLISISDLTKEEIEKILDLSAKAKHHSFSLPKRKILACCFFEPSTRTRLSFESAMLRLGGSVIGFSDALNTSTQKGESLRDSIRVIGTLADVIVIRHGTEGAARISADATETPVINGGDGSNQHPTQTLLDLFTIRELQGKIDGLNIGIMGDLKYGRAVHSLILGLCHYSVRIFLFSPPDLQLPEEISSQLYKSGVKFSYDDDFAEVLPKLDILYLIRLQKERHDKNIRSHFAINRGLLSTAKPSFRILHPLPRLKELDSSVDEMPHAAYFQQAANGLFVRQALLSLILGE